jgi:hypothetical protein
MTKQEDFDKALIQRAFENKKVDSRVYYVGVFLTQPKPGREPKIAQFACKDKEKIPATVLFCKLIETNDATKEANKVLEEYLAGNSKKEVQSDLKIGYVCNHSDGCRTHAAICVGIHNNEFKLLFFTSTIKWNKFSRLATEEELAFAGFSNKDNSKTYLAPVCRSKEDIFWTDRKLPVHRIKELDNEFFKPNLMKEIVRL